MTTLRELLRDGRFTFAFVVICALIFLGMLSFFSPYDIGQWNVVPRDMPPSIEHLLGTNSKGQDVFWEMTFAIRNSILMAVITAFFSRIIAVIVGLVAGFKGGTTDRVLMSMNDSFIVIPVLPILILLGSILKERLNIISLGLVLALFGWAWDARVIRAQILSLREREFTYTAILSGQGTLKLIFKEYIPFIIPIVSATAINNMFWAVGMEVTLSILGLSNLSLPTLGTMLYWAINYQAMLLGYWWWVITPVIISVFLFIALYLLSVSISEYLDPRTRIQRIGTAREVK